MFLVNVHVPRTWADVQQRAVRARRPRVPARAPGRLELARPPPTARWLYDDDIHLRPDGGRAGLRGLAGAASDPALTVSRGGPGRRARSSSSPARTPASTAAAAAAPGAQRPRSATPMSRSMPWSRSPPAHLDEPVGVEQQDVPVLQLPARATRSGRRRRRRARGCRPCRAARGAPSPRAAAPRADARPTTPRSSPVRRSTARWIAVAKPSSHAWSSRYWLAAPEELVRAAWRRAGRRTPPTAAASARRRPGPCRTRRRARSPGAVAGVAVPATMKSPENAVGVRRADLGVDVPPGGQRGHPAVRGQPVAQVDEHEVAGRSLQAEPVPLARERDDRDDGGRHDDEDPRDHRRCAPPPQAPRARRARRSPTTTSPRSRSRNTATSSSSRNADGGTHSGRRGDAERHERRPEHERRREVPPATGSLHRRTTSAARVQQALRRRPSGPAHAGERIRRSGRRPGRPWRGRQYDVPRGAGHGARWTP